jgi:muramoyltetrapeptide carboxypeptidase
MKNVLNKGDKVGIFLPSSPVKEPYRSKGLECLRGLGFVPVEVEGVLGKSPDADFLARSVPQGSEDIRHFVTHREIKALWAGRGGYGSNLLLSFLSQLDINDPMMIIGSSDVSYILWHYIDHPNIDVYYGPMVYSSLAEGRFDEINLMQVLSGNYQGMKVDGEPIVPGKAEGIVTGGCLSNLVSLLGTPYFPSLTNRILLLEDVGERPYRLDRMLWQLQQAEVFSSIKGLLLGQFPRCFKDESERENFLQRVRFYVKDYQFPVIFNLPYGHCDNIHTLPLGVIIKIDTSQFDGIEFISTI